MAIYFTQNDIKLYLSPDLFHRWFGNEDNGAEGWAGIPGADGVDRFNALAEGASSVVEGFLRSAGFKLPLEAEMLPLVKRVTIFRFLIDLYVLSGEEIPVGLNDISSRADSELNDIALGQIKLAKPPQISTGMGGIVSDATPALMSRNRMFGNF